MLRNKVVAPLEVFVRASSVVARGEYQAVASGELALPEERRDEIGVLARTFRVMSQQAEDNRENMERKVGARTQQLALAIDDARKANEAKSSFLARMSHEIRTPMNAVMGMSRLALKTDLNDKQRDYVEKIFVSAESLLRILNDILDFSKIEAGRLTLENVSFHLLDVLRSVSGVVSLKAHSKGLELLFDVRPDVPRYLVGDALRVGQVIINLATNAVKFTERGEVALRVSCESRDDQRVCLRFTVSDTGTGVSADRLGALFEPFTQEDDSITRKYGGTGLGLAICKQLVEMMGGTISATSEPGRGSQFTFTATLGVDAAVGDAGQLCPVVDRLQGTRALVVDDNSLAREILIGLLSQMGMRATGVESGERALMELGRGRASPDPYTLMLLDCNMPGLNGVDTARLIHHDDSFGAPMAILMVTAYSHDDLAAEAAEVGISHVLTKPVNESTLHDAIVECLLGSSALKARRQERARRVSKPIDLLRQRGARILLAEDSPLNRQVALEFLEEIKVDVDVAVNGLEAVEMVQRQLYDLVLMDIQMPELDGISATKRLRADSRYANLPIVAMTAHAMTGDRELSLAAGMSDHITKPIDPDRLYAVLARWLPRRRSADPRSAVDADAVRKSAPLPTPLAQLADSGIDAGAGLARYLGRVPFYLNVLRGFVSEYHNAPELLDKLYSVQAREEIFRLAHTLKANAEGIGASALAQAARHVEESAREQLPAPEAIAALRAALEHALGALDGVAAEQILMGDSASCRIDMPTALEQMVLRLEQDDAVSLDLARQLQRIARGTPFVESVDELARLIEDVEYEKARALAHALLCSLADARGNVA
ncbi:MAG: response regulator [Gammaproteobacteria bacterium]